MEYLTGGCSIKRNKIGYKITLTAKECGEIATLIEANSVTAAALSTVLGITGVGAMGSAIVGVLAAVGGAGAYYMNLCASRKGATMNIIYAGNVYLGFTPLFVRW